METLVNVNLWGKNIAVTFWDKTKNLAIFQYIPEFIDSGIQVAPLTMPLRETPYSFPDISQRTFKGLPGFLADSIPDKFGNLLIDQWLIEKNISRSDFSSLDRLCYIGKRGMGALEFEPAIDNGFEEPSRIHVEKLVDLANKALRINEGLKTSLFENEDNRENVLDILKVSTSAGGARAKAIVAWNEKTGELQSGQINAPEGFGYWIMKFDGIDKNKDRGLVDPQGMCTVEYTYHKMAIACGIKMSECRLFYDGERQHFMTRRFDRDPAGKKIHYQSLCAMTHYDIDHTGVFSYEQVISIMRQLRLSQQDITQQYRRTILNILARNQDDHTKNIGFLMNKEGIWKLSPAFDVTYAYDPSGLWNQTHQLTINGKTDKFTLDDLISFGSFCNLKKTTAKKIIKEIGHAVSDWPALAKKNNVFKYLIAKIKKGHRTNML